MVNGKPKATAILLMLWSALLSLAWLIPYHFEPWAAFHMDAWMGVMLGAASAVIFWRFPGRCRWPLSACVVAAAVLIPWGQFLAAVIPFAGEAWVTSLYLAGFLFAILLGGHWEKAKPDECFGVVCAALLVAAVFSVWLQLGYWLNVFDVGLYDTWTMGMSGDRPYANLGQPNQLATLLVWALLACLWFHIQGVFSRPTALTVAAFLLLGIALTQSRTGVLEILAVVVALFIWRQFWMVRGTQWVAVALMFFYIGCIYGLPPLREALLLGQDTSFERYGRVQDLRLPAWRLFMEVVAERPWWGYGWTPLRHAQLTVAGEAPALHSLFASSHNLLLDAALWLGLPLALVVAGLGAWWLWRHLRTVRQPQDVVLVLFLCTVLIHAMLEFPLQYAYMLLPVGLVIGILDARRDARPIWRSPRPVTLLLTLAGAACLTVTARDYLLVERAYVAMRLTNAKIVAAPATPLGPPDVWVLTQFREWFRFIRFASHPGMTPQEIEWVETVTMYYPTPAALYRMAATLVINGRPTEATVWLQRLCATNDAQICDHYRAAWEKEARTNADVAKAPWPS